jgi:dTDP-4-amino-4,6-dideoxygalactose transaminase
MLTPAATPSDGAMVNPIPASGHGRRFFRRRRLLLQALSELLDAGVNRGTFVQGPFVRALETSLAQSWQVAGVIAVNSGSSALRLAFEALRLQAGREVIVPALTFISTAYAVSDAGLVPVFVDVDPQTLTIDPRAAQAAITEKTAAIVAVHLYGQMAEMLPLLDLPELDTWNARRRAIAARYSVALAHSVVQAPVTASGRSHVFFNYAVRSPSVEEREQFERHLRAAGIEVAEAYTLISDQRAYRSGRLACRVEALEVARAVADLVTHIPLYPELEEEEIERIVTASRECRSA